MDGVEEVRAGCGGDGEAGGRQKGGPRTKSKPWSPARVRLPAEHLTDGGVADGIEHADGDQQREHVPRRHRDVVRREQETAGAPGARKPRSTEQKPMKASMHTRPCFSSASRIHFMLYALPSPSGSSQRARHRAVEVRRLLEERQRLRLGHHGRRGDAAHSGERCVVGERSGRPGEADGDDEEAPHFMQRDLFVLEPYA